MKRSLFAVIAVCLSSASSAQCIPGVNPLPIMFNQFDSLDFSVHIDTLNPNNQWQIGQPQKNFLSAAYSPVNALATDTVNPCLPNDTSIVILTLEPPIFQNIYLRFRHKYDIDSNHQRAYIQFSYNGGVTWKLMENFWGDDSCEMGYREWQYCDDDTTALDVNHPFVGTSSGWHQSGYLWRWLLAVRMDISDTVSPCIIPPDTLLVRFVFETDSVQSSHEGWMIDDLKVFAVSPGIGIDEVQTFDVNLYPNPLKNELRLMTDVGITSWWIRNLFGQLVLTVDDDSRHANVSELSPGYYIMEAQTADGAVGRKAFVKQ